MRWALVAVAAWAAAVAILAVLGWPASRYVDNDFAGFWLGSRALLEGLDPYDAGTWAALHERIGSRGFEVVPAGSGYGYPLTTALVFAPFALFPIWLAAPLWLVSQLVSAGAALIGLGRRLFPATARRELLVLFGLAAAAQPVWLLAAGGNVGGFLLAIAATSAALLLVDRPFAAGAVAALLVIKPHPLIVAVPLLVIVLPRDRTMRAVAGAIAVAAPLLLAAFVLRPSWLTEWLASAARIGASAAARATLFGLLPSDVRPLGWIAVVAIVVVFATWSRGKPLDLVIGAAIAVAIFCAPYGWSYDHTVLLVTVAVTLGVAGGAATWRRTAVLLALAIAIVIVPWTLFVVAFRRGDEALSAFSPLILLGVLLFSARLARARG